MLQLYRINHWINKGIDLLFPPRCAVCAKTGSRFCASCYQQSTFMQSIPHCTNCGDLLMKAGICTRCHSSQPAFEALCSLLLFEGTAQKVIHRLKYKNDLLLGETMADQMLGKILEKNWDIDDVCPIPLSKQRQRERGYNQAALLAVPLAAQLGLPCRRKWLYRKRHTPTQIGLDRSQRALNVEEAFSAVAMQVEGRTILLVDDVITTGATMQAAAFALKAAGAAAVYGASYARAASIQAN